MLLDNTFGIRNLECLASQFPFSFGSKICFGHLAVPFSTQKIAFEEANSTKTSKRTAPAECRNAKTSTRTAPAECHNAKTSTRTAPAECRNAKTFTHNGLKSFFLTNYFTLNNKFYGRN